jgi:hypothetical protein
MFQNSVYYSVTTQVPLQQACSYNRYTAAAAAAAAAIPLIAHMVYSVTLLCLNQTKLITCGTRNFVHAQSSLYCYRRFSMISSAL